MLCVHLEGWDREGGRGKFLSVTSALSEGWAFVSVSWTSVMMWAQNKKEHGS